MKHGIHLLGKRECVTPCVGVWIETQFLKKGSAVILSHPAWVCGLKPREHFILNALAVTPCVGVWIETENRDEVGQDLNVTPCVGVWIETENQQKPYTTLWVTPCVGVWIETENILYDFLLS